jgi:hypothetical protein
MQCYIVTLLYYYIVILLHHYIVTFGVALSGPVRDSWMSLISKTFAPDSIFGMDRHKGRTPALYPGFHLVARF